MKKILLILIAVLAFCPQSNAEEINNIALLTQKGFFETQQVTSAIPCEAVKRTLYLHQKYANSYNLDKLRSLYSEQFINADGLNKELYFDLIKKTWASYPDIKYKMDIINIQVDGDMAVVQVNESADATTTSKSGMVNENGLLSSISNSVYYFEKINNEWLITSDHIIFEKTSLRYGSAKNIQIELSAPCQILANTQYTTSLNIEPPKNSLVIASIGRENITYPQTVAEEIFRKLPDDGTLERVFVSNSKNLNEYAVASFGITKAEISNGTEVKIYVTGLGFVMSRVNVIPKNDFIKVANNEKSK